GPERGAQRRRPRAGHEHAPLPGGLRAARDLLLDPLEKLEDLFGLLRLVALVVLPLGLQRVRLEDDGLDGRRAYVDADQHPLRLPWKLTLRSVRAKGNHSCGWAPLCYSRAA